MPKQRKRGRITRSALRFLAVTNNKTCHIIRLAGRLSVCRSAGDEPRVNYVQKQNSIEMFRVLLITKCNIILNRRNNMKNAVKKVVMLLLCAVLLIQQSQQSQQ
jgi:hypothetical protein